MESPYPRRPSTATSEAIDRVRLGQIEPLPPVRRYLRAADLADLELAGRSDEAEEETNEALDRYRHKGNVMQAAIAEARLARLGASP
jgi:hypothetical protein